MTSNKEKLQATLVNLCEELFHPPHPSPMSIYPSVPPHPSKLAFE